MGVAAKKIDYPYITSDPEIAGEAPLIEGTRITVRTVAGYYQMGMSVDEILNCLRQLSPSQVHSALAYYFDHQDEINADLEESTDEGYWKEKALTHPGHRGDRA